MSTLLLSRRPLRPPSTIPAAAAGLPHAASVTGTAAAAVPLAALRRHRGRRPGLRAGWWLGALGALGVVVATAAIALGMAARRPLKRHVGRVRVRVNLRQKDEDMGRPAVVATARLPDPRSCTEDEERAVAMVEASIEIDAPVSMTYNQWTQFEEFPHFMDGVEAIEQIDDTTLRWRVELAGATREFVADITTQQPDECVAWTAREGQGQSGVVRFETLPERGTRVDVRMDYDVEARDTTSVGQVPTSPDVEAHRAHEEVTDTSGEPPSARSP